MKIKITLTHPDGYKTHFEKKFKADKIATLEIIRNIRELVNMHDIETKNNIIIESCKVN